MTQASPHSCVIHPVIIFICLFLAIYFTGGAYASSGTRWFFCSEIISGMVPIQNKGFLTLCYESALHLLWFPPFTKKKVFGVVSRLVHIFCKLAVREYLPRISLEFCFNLFLVCDAFVSPQLPVSQVIPSFMGFCP